MGRALQPLFRRGWVAGTAVAAYAPLMASPQSAAAAIAAATMAQIRFSS